MMDDEEIDTLADVPSYVDQVDIPAAPDTNPEIATASGVDEYGLPVVPPPVATALK